MILFITLAALLVLAALLFVAAPLLSRRGGTVDRDKVDAVAITRQKQLADLERELADGEIDNRTYELTRREIESESSAQQAEAESGPATTTGWPVSALVAAVLIPAATIFLYWHVGSPEAIEGPRQAEFGEMDMAAAVDTLESRLADQPDDLEGWMMLGRSRVAMQQYDRAVEAFRQAVEIAGEENARVLAHYGEAITLRDPGQMISHAAPLFRRVLELDPEQPKGLWYSGLIAYEQGEYGQAEDHWRTLLQQDPPGEFRRVVEDRLAAARQAQGKDPVGEEMDEQALLVRVELSSDFQDKVSPNDTVFLIARAVEGERAPLAGVRLPVSALPGPFRLGDENAMIEGQRLSDHESVELIARVSFSGQAMPEPGDLRGSVLVSTDDAQETPFTLVIDTEMD